MTDLVPTRSLDEQKDLAVLLAKSELLPRAYVGKPQNIIVAMQWADVLGIAPMTAMQQLYIIDGKPTASAQMIGSLVRRAGHLLRVAGDEKRAVCEITRCDDPDFVFKSVWTIERAVAAGLANKATWKQYPAAMLKARALTEAARDACPEALLGVAYTPEELQHTVRATATVVSTDRLVPTPNRQPHPDIDELTVDADGVVWDADDDAVLEEAEPAE